MAQTSNFSAYSLDASIPLFRPFIEIFIFIAIHFISKVPNFFTLYIYIFLMSEKFLYL